MSPSARRRVFGHAVCSKDYSKPRGGRGSRAHAGRSRTPHIRYIEPAGSGDRTGGDQRNAARLADINDMIRLVGPGGTVYLRADAGPYSTTGPITISHGGSAGDPVQVKGIDSGGALARALITGTRTSPCPTTAAAFATMSHGNEVFGLDAGANHLHFSSLGFRDVGNGAFFVRANLVNLTLEDIVATNVRRFLERSGDSEHTVTGLTVRRVVVSGFSKSVARLDGDTSGVLLEDVLGDSMGQDFDNFPVSR